MQQAMVTKYIFVVTLNVYINHNNINISYKMINKKC